MVCPGVGSRVSQPRVPGVHPQGYDRRPVSHQVLSRKYRPQHFADLVGQEHVARILANALRSDRVGHAYLFVGPRGVGKTTTARIFARALNCTGRPLPEVAPGQDATASIEPCGTCPSCVDIAAGSDLDVVEMDAASNNHVEDVRNLREQVAYATVRAANRIWIVDEVHMLSLPAFNAFLKTLEEPPAHVKFVFCTTEEHKLPDTFRSRCQRVEFRPIAADAMAERLRGLAEREGVTLEEGVASAIASSALGGLRDGESVLEQLIAACPDARIRRTEFDLLCGRAPSERLDALEDAVAAGDAAAALDAVDACLASGCKPGVLLDQWLENTRARLVASARATEGERPSLPRLSRAVDVLLQKRLHLRGGADGVLIAQVTAIELARLPDARDLDALVGALRGTAVEPTPGVRSQSMQGGQGGADPVGGGARARESRSSGRSSGSPSSGSQGSGGASEGADEPSPSRRERAPSSPPVARTEPAQRDAAPASRSRAPDIDDIRLRWDEFLEALSRRDGRLSAAARTLEPEAVVEDTLHLRLPREIDGVRAMFARREIQIAFSQVAGVCLGVRLRAVIDEAPDLVQHIDVDGPDLRSHPAVTLVTDVTKGRLLSVEKAESSDAVDAGVDEANAQR